MVTKVLLDYIQSETARGISKETIRSMLIKSGWQIADVDEAEGIVYGSTIAKKPLQFSSAPQNQTAPTQTQNAQSPISQVHPNITKPISLTAALEAYKQKNTVIRPDAQPTAQTTATTVPQVNVQRSTFQNPFQNPAQDPQNPNAHIIANNPVTNVAAEMKVMTHYPKRSGIRTAKLMMAAFGVLIAGAGAYGYFTGYFVTDAKMASNIFGAMQMATSAKFDTTISIDTTNLTQQPPMINLLPGFAPNISFTAEGMYSNTGSPITSALLSFATGTFVVSADTRLIGNMLYLKAVNVPAMPLFDLGAYKDQWLSVATDQADQVAVPVLSDVVTTINTLQLITQNTTSETTPTTIFKVTKRFLPTKIDGTIMRHFAFTITQSDSFDTSNLTNIVAEAWVGQSDNLPRKIIATYNKRQGQNENDIEKVTIETHFTDWNTDIGSVDTPIDSIPFSVFLETVLKNAQSKSLDQNLRTIAMNLESDAENYFDTNTLSYKNYCKTSNVISALNDATITGCKDSVGAFVIFTQLTEENTGFYCVDSLGSDVVLPKAPTGLACK